MSESAPRTIYTIGHSDRTPEELVERLASDAVERVVDVRSSPWSRRHPWHGRAEMERWLAEAGIAYTWLGHGLGGLRPEGFDAHRSTRVYRRALEQLAEAACRQRVAILCAERDPWMCHRRAIADDLTRLGFRVLHRIDARRLEPHQNQLDF